MQNYSNTPSARYEGYIRRHSHDVRNCLAAMDLQTILLQNTSSGLGENKHLSSLRRLIVCLEELQLRLGLRFRVPTTAAVALSSLFEQCQSRQRVSSADKEVVWAFDGDDCCSLADGQAVCVIIIELADHFFSLGGGTIKAFARGGDACFQMQRSCDNESAQRTPAIDTEVNGELISVVAHLGGALTFGPDGLELLVTFPQAPVGGSGTADR